ncbi:MAG: class I SAM-dependent methyltransferase [Alistipes sp.]|jgi:SAM-dependent methyltransferase|nr:class I SAM-dependent methyltransferase [Alistipes sp.]
MSTAQRVSQVDPSDNFVLARSVLAYRRAVGLVSGRVVEIGTGNGYGVELLAGAAESLVTLDKHLPAGLELPSGVEFRRMKVPPIELPSDSFDFAVSFQVIEHIRRDGAFLDEVRRVLRPGGRFIVTTPNAAMSLTRNPWHVREYTAGQFSALVGSRFSAVEAMGVFGDERVMEYYEHNRAGVEAFARLDPLSLRNRLPRWMLRVPYDVANRMNRRRLLAENEILTRGITPDNYRLEPISEGAVGSESAFDLFFICTK